MLKPSQSSKHIGRTNTNEEDPNPKTLCLEKVVSQIDSKVLAYYLEQISVFLKKNKKDLWFPKLTPYLDAFLVRVIRDEQNMKNLLDILDSKSRAFATDIINSLNENEEIYTLSYSYENNRIDSDILVYRKVFLKESKPSHNKNAEGTSANKPPDTQANNIPNVDWVKATLRFIEDDTWTVLEYPVMSYKEVNEVYSVIKQSNKDVTHLGPLCLSLLDAISDFNETRELKASFLYMSNNEVQLSIEKKKRKSIDGIKKSQPIIRNNSKLEQKSVLNESKKSDTDCDLLTKAEKAFVKRKQLIESMDKAFIKTALKMILDFVSTEEEASLVFKNANENQCMFIQSACAMAKTPKFHILFDKDSRDILKSIFKILIANQWYELRIDVAKVQKDNKLRTVSLIKYPKQSYQKRDSSVIKDNIEYKAEGEYGKRSKSLDRKYLPNKSVIFESGGNLEQVIGGVYIIKDENDTPITNKNKVKTNNPSTSNDTDKTLSIIIKDVPTTKNKNVVPTAANDNHLNMSFEEIPDVTDQKERIRLSRVDFKDQSDLSDIKRAKSVPPMVKEKEMTAKTKDVNLFIDDKRLCLRRSKLLKAMSIPIESDIATRMMRQMGWHGGPLGIRGEGITEPIIPALHLTSKAGLGHVKPDSKLAYSFRLNFYQNLLFLLTNDESVYTIEFKTPIVPKEKKFITEMVKVFNIRRKVNENEEAIKEVVNEIMKEMILEPDMQLICKISKDKKCVTLLKEIKTVKPRPEDRDTTVMQECINLPKVINTACIKSIGLHYNTKGPRASKLGLAIIFRYKIMEFMKSDLLESTIKFDCEVARKSINYFKDLVQKIHQKSKQTFQLSIEKYLNTETMKYANGVMLSAICDDKRSFVLRKSYMNDQSSYTKELCDIANNNSNIIDKNKQTEKNIKHEDSQDVFNVVDNEIEMTDEMKNCTADCNDTVTNYTFLIKEEISPVDTNESIDERNSFELQDMDREIRAIDKISCSKRHRSDSENSNCAMKKTKTAVSVSYLFIYSEHGGKVSNDDIEKFQMAVAEKIDSANNFPLLECHGVENGAIIYGCHNEVGATLIKSVANEMEFTTKTYEKYRQRSCRKLKIRVNSYIGINLKKFLNLIECYNVGLSTENWAIEDVEVFRGYFVISVEVDYMSFQYIMEANFSLFAGVDKVRFCIAWD